MLISADEDHAGNKIKESFRFKTGLQKPLSSVPWNQMMSTLIATNASHAFNTLLLKSFAISVLSSIYKNHL